ncbi:MAG: NAD(P)H-hydrate dehydratase, partial [Candidatus Aenigmarchaeota archaeon]|nr:NAD(P)H-hydrate dehydratase [Candidatus Aenigmarchaeota archaeon]
LSMIKEVRGTAVVIGPGLWREKETNEAIIKLVEKIELPMVIDADAIRAVAGKRELLRKKSCIITPHADEFKSFSGVAVTNNIRERSRAVRIEARKINNTIVLKGNVDIISDGYKVMLNKTGSNLMTKGGFGDTLTGLCGAYLARGNSPFLSACVAAYVNGKAGELAAKKDGKGILPTDMLEYIPKVIR